MPEQFTRRWSDSVSDKESFDPAVIMHRIATVEDAVVHSIRAVEAINKSLEQLVRLDERNTNQQTIQTAILEDIKDMHQRLLSIERRSDFWDRSSRAVWVGMLAIAGLAGMYVWNAARTMDAQRAALTEYRNHILQETQTTK